MIMVSVVINPHNCMLSLLMYNKDNFKMASVIKIDQLNKEDKEFLQNSLDCEGEEIFDIVNNEDLYIPFAFAQTNFVLDESIIKPTESMKFTGSLRPEQSIVKDYVMNNRSTIVCSQPGFGKTITAISIACAHNVKTVVIVNKLLILDQWVNAFHTFSPETKIQIVNPKRTHDLDDKVSVYIVNAINILKKPFAFWSNIKFVIVDELHQIVTKKLCLALLRFVPDVILGLSATPFRYDEYDQVIKWFFGENVIGEKLNRNHKYKIIKTHWIPTDVRYTRKGLDWGKILDEQANDKTRNEIIARECTNEIEKGRTILVLVKRVIQADLLFEALLCNGVTNVAKLVRSDRTFDKKCNVLIGTTSKIGVGFDHAPIDCLVVAADVKNYFVQFLGRCMRSPNTIPLVLDFDDEFGVLKKHLNERLNEYKVHGGSHVV
jgi:superfamily II DNA or RNA helicase